MKNMAESSELNTRMMKISLMVIIFEISGLCSMNAPILEYCGSDTFSPSCQEGEILIIHHAHYGRMKIGRCVTIDLGYLGCTSDALAWMDRQCSGKQSCVIRVPNHELNERLECSLPVDITPYLEVSSSCSHVTSAQTKCSSPYNIYASVTKKILSSEVTHKSGCGSEAAPWVIQGKPGQQINISLLDFYWDDQQKDDSACPVEYGYIVDGETSDMATICGGSNRHKHLQISKGNMIQVVLKQEVVEEFRFLLQYSVVGCEDLKPPRGAWTKRHTNTLTIGCYNDGGHQWTVTCNGSKWLGHYGNCERDQNVQTLTVQDKEPKSSVPKVVMLTLIGSITAVLCCVAITSILAFFCIRKQKQIRKNKEHYLQTLPLNQHGTMDIHQFRTIQSYRPTTMSHQRTGSQSDWNNTVSVRLPQNTNIMMTSMTSSMGASDTIYDVVPTTEDIQRNTNLI